MSFTCDRIPDEKSQNAEQRLDRVSGGVEHCEKGPHDGHQEAEAYEGDGGRPQAHVDELLVNGELAHSFKQKIYSRD